MAGQLAAAEESIASVGSELEANRSSVVSDSGHRTISFRRAFWRAPGEATTLILLTTPYSTHELKHRRSSKESKMAPTRPADLTLF